MTVGVRMVVVKEVNLLRLGMRILGQRLEPWCKEKLQATGPVLDRVDIDGGGIKELGVGSQSLNSPERTGVNALDLVCLVNEH